MLQKIEKLIESGEYEKAADLFLSKTGTIISKVYSHAGAMPWDSPGTKRHVYNISLSRGEEIYLFQFGDSPNNYLKTITVYESRKTGEKFGTKEPVLPSNYNVLSCLSINYFDSADDVYEQFGEMKPSQAEAIYKEDLKLRLLFSNEDEQNALNAIS